MSLPLSFSGQEQRLQPDEIIVSKTDLKGRITYVNQTFMTISGYVEKELIGQPHSLIRHPKMPRCVFKLLWDKIASGQEIFAYVVNSCKNGDYYWVFAHVTPSRDEDGNIIGYHSNRRSPERRVVEQVISPLYADLLQIEERFENRKDGMNAAGQKLNEILQQRGKPYDEFILSL
jgi:PAS domain S-box-containing protein